MYLFKYPRAKIPVLNKNGSHYDFKNLGSKIKNILPKTFIHNVNKISLIINLTIITFMKIQIKH